MPRALKPRPLTAAQQSLVLRWRYLPKWVLDRMDLAKALQCLQYDDLLQAGALGLIRAAQKWDPSRAKFSFYAVLWIRQCVRLTIAHGHTVRPPVAYLVSRDARRQRPRHGALALAAANARPLPAGFDLPAPAGPDLAGRDEVEHLMRVLDPEARRVIRLRYLDGYTLAEAGAVLGISRERVRQIQERGLARMREGA